MNLSVNFLNRDFSQNIQPPAIFDVVRYSHNCIGGPLAADVIVSGDPNLLMLLLGRLRSPVEIYDDRGRIVWWGYAAEISVRIGMLTIGVSLDSMYNRISVVYSLVAPGTNSVGTRATTSIASDQTSIDEYGYKELQASISGATTLQANQMRDILLAKMKYPIATIEQSGEIQEISASIRCRGWFDTLNWRNYSNSTDLEDFTTGSDTQVIGAAAANTKGAQSFQLSSSAAWSAYSVKVHIAKTGAPADNVILDLCADSAGAPGTVLATVSIAAASIPTSADWVEGVLSVSPALALATTYWLVVRRSGGNDAVNYYVVSVDEGLGYTSGVFRLWGGASWAARSPDADMQFQITGIAQTTAQISTLVTAAGQFLTATDIENASGLYSSAYRDGDTSAMAELLDLLKAGTTNNRRLLAQVTNLRRLQVYEEPASNSAQYMLHPDGSITNRFGGAIIEPHLCLMGVWMQVESVMDLSIGFIANPSLIFVESAEYDVASGLLTLTPRGAPTPWDVLSGLAAA